LDQLKEDLISFIKKYDQSVHLIGHSFGVKLILETLKDLKAHVASITLVAPSTDMISGEKYVFDMAYKRFSKDQPEMALKLKKLIPQLTDKVDESRIKALELAFESGYIMDYFVHQKNFESYFSFLNGDNAFNVENFLKIRRYINKDLPDNSNFQGKSTVIFGADDPAFKMENELKLIQKSLPEVEVKVINNVRHYPHIEATEEFINLIFKSHQEI
jgi:pimeloyl-ACP methyl ester carboxylesterase